MRSRIFLVGYRCVGKSTVARHLARMLACSWVDLDVRIEEDAGRPIGTLVAEEGWEAFRDRESLALEQVIAEGFGVIATGGGIVTRPDNIRKMRDAGRVVRLSALAETVVQRMEEDLARGAVRPSLTGTSALDEVRDVMAARATLYAAAAHDTVDTDLLTPEALALKILSLQ